MAKYSITAVMGVVTDKLKKGLTGAAAKVKGLGAAFSKGMGHPAVQAALQAGKAIVDMGVQCVKTAGKIDASMNEVFTLLPGITKDAKEKMTKEMLDLSSEMGKMPEDMMGSLYNALSAGVPKDNVFDFLKTASKSAIAGVATTEQAVGALTTVINGYKLPATEAANVSDTLFTIIKNGVTTMPELAANIGKVTPMAASLGIKFEHVGAAFAELTKNLGPGKSAETGTMLKAMFAEMAKGGSKAAMAFERISGKSFPNFIKGGGTMREALQMMAKDADSSGKRITDLFGSIEAGQAALILSSDNAAGLGKQIAEMGKKAGASDAAFKTVDQGFSRMMEKLMAGFEQFKYTVGTALSPVVNSIMPLFLKGLKMIQGLPWDSLGKVLGENMKLFEPIMEALFELVKEIFPLIGPLLTIGTSMIMRLLPVLMILIKLLTALMPPIVWIVEKIAWVFGLFNKLMGWITKLIGGIGKAKDESKKTTEKIVEGVKNVEKKTSGFVKFLKSAYDWAKGALSWYWNQVKSFWKWVFDSYKHFQAIALIPFKMIIGLIKIFRAKLISFIKWYYTTVGEVWDYLKGLLGKAKARLYEIFPWLEQLVDTIQQKIKDKVKEVWEKLKYYISLITDKIKNLYNEIREIIFNSETETGKALQHFWLAAESVGKKFIKLFKNAGSVIKAIGGAVNWVAGKLGFAGEQAAGATAEVEKMGAATSNLEEVTGKTAGQSERLAEAKSRAADQEERMANNAANTAKQLRQQKADAEAIAKASAQSLAQEKLRRFQQTASVQAGAKIIKNSGVNVKLLQATIGKHKDVNSMAELYSIIGKGKKTPAQLIAEAKKQQEALNKKGKGYTIKSPNGKTPAEQIKGATKEQKKLNEEAAKNPLLNLTRKGMEVKATMVMDPKYASETLKRLKGIHSDTSGIYKKISGLFVNQ